MQQPEIPNNEQQRLTALSGSALLDTEAELRFDRITSLVQQCLGTEIVLISLVDAERQWFKSRQGLDACETGRDISFCGHAILSDDIFEIPDASKDKRFADNPLVTAAPFIRFYAGAPLHFKGQRIGTLCIIDPKPRQLSISEQQILRQFADITEQEIFDKLQEQADVQMKASRDQFKNLLTNIPGVVYQYQQWPDGRAAFPYASANIQKIYGVLPEQVENDATPAFQKIHPDDLAGLVQSIDVSAAGLSLWQHQYRVYNEDKTLIWMSGRASPERMQDGSTLWHGYIEDITTTKQYYLQLEQLNKEYQLSQQRLEMASETALIGFWQASLKTGELWWSPVIYQIFGFDNNTTPSVALFKSTLHPDDRQLVADSEQRALVTGLHDVVHRVIRPDGGIRWVHELAKLLPEDENPQQILVGSVQDVTERMQLQQMKDAFISTVSHELRTPLTAIKGALGLLNSGKLGQVPPKMQKLMQVANSNSERLAQLINDLLDVEKLAAGKMPFYIQPHMVQAELQLAVDNLQSFANQLQVVIELQPIAKGLVVQADSQRLQQIVTNLLSNAIKFSPPDSKVLLSAEQQRGQVLFKITDYGSGIPEEFKQHIFERFAQADGSNQRQNGGTGLGLAICKELVQQMGGSIGFDSAPNEGTTFYFSLPTKPDTIN